MLLSDFKRGYFDTPAVVKATDAATRKAFSKYGAFVRQRARTSMKKRAGPSPPGTPPHAHKEPGLRQILFAYDTATRSVVVGPVSFARRSPGPATIPEAQEYGGRIASDRYRERPFMRPAAETEQRKLSDILRDKVR